MHERIEIQFPCAKPNYTLAQEAFAHTLSVIEGSSTRLARQHLFATNNPSAPPDEADSDNDLQNDMGF
jgi:hypothetical protein